MLSPEKNEVDINQLFEYKKPITLHGNRGKKKTVYMRVIGDADINKARVKSLRASRELRDALKDKTSDEYLAYIPDISEAGIEKITELLVMFYIDENSSKIVDSLDLPFPEEPGSDDTLEEREQYQLEVDNYSKEWEALIQKKFFEVGKKRKEELEKLDETDLLEIYEGALVRELCRKKMTQTYYEYVVLYSLYSDEKYVKPLYTEFSRFDNLPSDIKAKLIEEYRTLELGIDDLKK